MIGEVPGEGMSAGLFMVVARTTVKSQLRSGLPLVEAMTAANRLLYEIGSGMALEALAGILEEDGTFSYINAGQCSPLLMRSKDRYEAMKEPVYAPLGQNENVVYQARKVTLRQGDRFFFCTAGLSRIADAEGEEFSGRQLQVTLNFSRGRNLDLDGLLRCVGDEGRAYAGRPEEVDSFAIMAFALCIDGEFCILLTRTFLIFILDILSLALCIRRVWQFPTAPQLHTIFAFSLGYIYYSPDI